MNAAKMAILEALVAASGGGEREDVARRRPLAEAQIMELKAMASDYRKPHRFRVGDIVTPKKNGDIREVGTPHIVLEINEEASPLLDGQIGTSEFGKRFDMRVANMSDEGRISAIGMKRHMAMLDPPDENKTDAEVFYDAFCGMVAGALSGDNALDELATKDSVTDARNAVIKRVVPIGTTQEKIIPVVLAAAGSSAEAAKRIKDVQAEVSELKRAVNDM